RERGHSPRPRRRSRTSARGPGGAPRPWEDRSPMRLVCLGDLLLDVIVRLEEPLAHRLRADAAAVTQVGPGGQAANVAAWAATLGAEARFVGKRGDDDAGRVCADGLAA